MKIFIDFDDVIFNTKKFRKDIAMIFTSHGISKKDYYASYFDPNDKGPIRTHDLDSQIERLKKRYSFDEKSLRVSLNEFMQDASEYLFEDVLPFIDLHKNNELIILSFGSRVFQEKKIRSSKIQKYIPDVIITDKPKAEALTNILKDIKGLQGEKIFLLDDRVEQIKNIKKKFPQIVTILLKRPEGRYQEMGQDQYCDFEAHNLAEAHKIIKKFI